MSDEENKNDIFNTFMMGKVRLCEALRVNNNNNYLRFKKYLSK